MPAGESSPAKMQSVKYRFLDLRFEIGARTPSSRIQTLFKKRQAGPSRKAFGWLGLPGQLLRFCEPCLSRVDAHADTHATQVVPPTLPIKPRPVV